MKDIPSGKSMLAEIAATFLVTLPPQDEGRAQIEVHKFIRWFGLHRSAAELSPVDVASYAGQLSSTAASPLRSFLTYLWRNKFTTVNLAPHLRIKTPSKTIPLAQQGSQSAARLTTQGYAELEAELATLKAQRAPLAEELYRAAADKDFSENAPLQAVREHKAHVEGRIQQLEATLKSSTIMSEGQPDTRIKIGDTVVLQDLTANGKLSYVLVDPREANPLHGKISVASPLGSSLLGKRKGETITVTAPAGIFDYRIEDIRSNSTTSIL